MSSTILKGSLKDQYLPEIFQPVFQNNLSGMFLFQDGPHRVQVFVRGGLFAHAVSTSQTKGLDALEELAVWTEGAYSFQEGTEPPALSINKPAMSILSGLSTKVDEWKVLSQVIKSIHIYPYSSLLPGEEVNFTAREKRVMDWINGHYTIAELSVAMGMNLTALAKHIYGLILRHRITLSTNWNPRPPAVATRDPAPSTTSAPSQPSTLGSGPQDGATSSASAGDSVGSAADYLKFARLICDTAKSVLPDVLHADIEAIFRKHKPSILFEQGATLQTMKTIAMEISRKANEHLAEGSCTRDAVLAYNTKVKAVFSGQK